MAIATNQRGYDVVTSEGKHVSVKTITTSTHVSFNEATFRYVDRIMVLRINFDETDASIEEILDCSAAEALTKVTLKEGKYHLNTYRKSLISNELTDLRVVSEATFEGKLMQQFENGTIKVMQEGQIISNAIAALREISAQIGVDIVNSSGNPKNTQRLGSDTIKALLARPGL